MSQSERVPYLLVAPSVVFLLVLFVWPLAETALMAFRTDAGVWTGQYLAKMLGDHNFGLALKNTLILVAIVVPLQVAIALAMGLCGWRLLRGPDMPDRILALDTLYVNVVALVILLGVRWQTAILFEAALIVAMLGFVGTVALSRYVSRGDVIE
mgnify:CR=1 FL=1